MGLLNNLRCRLGGPGHGHLLAGGLLDADGALALAAAALQSLRALHSGVLFGAGFLVLWLLKGYTWSLHDPK